MLLSYLQVNDEIVVPVFLMSTTRLVRLALSNV
jgi:hypothetical protein